jgi:hypothetical protein
VSVQLALRLTALVLLLRPMGPWTLRPLILAAAGLALLSPRVLMSSWTWYGLTALLAARIVADWPLPDNHVYLLMYWCLAISLALGAATPDRVLMTSARLLIGTAFLMAIIWKGMLSPDYLDGRFFRVTWLTDERFGDAVQLFGQLSQPQLEHNRVALRPMPEGARLVHPPSLEEPSAFRHLVLASTWGIFTLEALVAVAFLCPPGKRSSMAQHAALLCFCGMTYAIAPVAGFGWLLLTMGLALCRADQQVLRGVYVGTWFLVLLYSEVPWAHLMVAWLSSSTPI